MKWLADLKGWFSATIEVLKTIRRVVKRVESFLWENLWALIPVLIAAGKSVFDFIKTSLNRALTALQNADVDHLRDDVGGWLGLSDTLATLNVWLPLDELFAWVTFLLSLMFVCAIVRGILWIKKLVLF